MQEEGIKLKRFYGGGAYDTSEVFYALGYAESTIKIRKNASTYRCRVSRREEVRRYLSLGYKAWAKAANYVRWGR